MCNPTEIIFEAKYFIVEEKCPNCIPVISSLKSTSKVIACMKQKQNDFNKNGFY